MSVLCLLWLFMVVEINILYGLSPARRGIMGTINLLELCTVSWYITHPFTEVLSELLLAYHITAAHACTHTHTPIQPYEFQPCSSVRHLSLAHAECVMREAWVRLGQILDFTGVLVWLWASGLRWNTLQFCWTTGRPTGPTPWSRVLCHRATANAFRGEDVLRIFFFLIWRMRRGLKT